MSGLKKNLGYQTIYQIISTCIPLITSPYLARVLGAERQGVFSFTQSVVNYFTLFAMLGVMNYGTRVIAACANKEERSISFFNIFIMQLVTSLLSLVCYVVYILFFCSENRVIATIQGVYIISCLLDINWFFFGLEKFKAVAIRSIIIRLVSLILILLLVNSPDDLWKYTSIMTGGTFFSNAVLWILIPREVYTGDLRLVSINSVYAHIKPNLVLFIPLLAMSFFHVMDKTMLGILSNYEQVGFYYNADKVINIPIGIINGIGTVMMPRMASLIERKENNEASKLFSLSIEAVFAVSCAMTFGIAAISREFVPLFFGKGFDSCITLIILLSPVLIIKGLSQTSRMEYLIPSHNEKIFIESVFAGTGVNLIVNLALIGKYGATGAVIGTLIAELVTCVWQYIKINSRINITSTIIKSMVYVLFGLIMLIVVRLVSRVFDELLFCVVSQILSGAIVYGTLCMLYWKITNNPVINTILKR